jgi:hypothetical protein
VVVVVEETCRRVVVVVVTCNGMECGVDRLEEEEKAVVETCSGKVVTWEDSGGASVVT